MESHTRFWLKCLRRARERGLSDFANDWQWTLAIPLATSAGVGVTVWSTGSPALDGFIAALFAFFLTWVLALFVRTLKAAPHLYYEEQARAIDLQGRLDGIMDSYSYRLQLETVSLEDLRELSKEDGTLQHRFLRYVLKLKSYSDYPLRYVIDKQSVNQEPQDATVNGGVIPPHGVATFYCSVIEGDKDNLTALVRNKLDLIVRYGHPDKLTRLMRKDLQINSFPASGGTNFFYILDTEQAIKDSDQDGCPAENIAAKKKLAGQPGS